MILTVRSMLGKGYVDGTRRNLHVADVGRSIQEEEEEGLPADGGMLGLLAQIYTGSLGQLVGAHMGYFHELIQVIRVQR